MIGLCGVAFAQGADKDLRILDLMSRAFANAPSRAVKSVTWRLPIVACRLFYRESERLPEPDVRLESVTASSPATAFAFGNVCPPAEFDSVTTDSLVKARFCFERAYGDGGLSSLAGINGNWAVAMCDNSNGTVVLARDPFGVQTLYYERLGQYVCFATHLSALERLDHRRQLDPTAVAQFLHYLYVPAPRTAYTSIKSVPVGVVVVVSRTREHPLPMHRRVPAPFWQERHIPDSKNGMSRAVSTFDQLLTEAVQARSAPMGRTAILLSGGKDSSSMCVAAAKIDPRRYLAITVGSDDSSIDESGDAAAVAQHLGIEHLTLRFSQNDYVTAFEEFVRAHGQPFGDPAGLSMYLALTSLPSDIETILEGSGPEVYMGSVLSGFHEIYLALPVLRLLALQLPSAVCGLLPRRMQTLVDRFRKPVRELFVSWNGWTEGELRELFGIDADLAHTEMGQLGKSSSRRHRVEFKTAAMDRIWVVETSYRKLAQPANYLNLTAGLPFADSRLAAYFSTLPEDLCFSRHVGKVVLREYMSRHLPRRIREKPKGRFDCRKEALLRADKHAVLRTYLLDGASGRPRMACFAQASAAVRRYLRGDSALSDRVFALTLLSAWLGQHPNVDAEMSRQLGSTGDVHATR